MAQERERFDVSGVGHHVEGLDALDDVAGERGDVLRHRVGVAAHVEERVDARGGEVLYDFWAEAFARGIEEDDVRSRPVWPILFEVERFEMRLEWVIL